MAEQEEHRSVIELRITNLEGAVGEIKQAVKSIDSSLQTLARLEVLHSETRDSVSRAFAGHKDHEVRLRSLESEAPTMRMIRGWVVAGVVGTAGLVGVGLFKVLVP